MNKQNEAKLSQLLPKSKLIKIVKAGVDFHFQSYEGDLYRYLTDVRKFRRLDVLMALGFYSELFAKLYMQMNKEDKHECETLRDMVSYLYDKKYVLRNCWAQEAGEYYGILKTAEEMDD